MTSADLTVSQIKGKRIFYLIFATITLLVLGLIYAWSIFAVPIGVSCEDYKPLLPVVFQVSMFAFCVSALFGAQLIKKTSAKLTIIVAAILMGVGFIATAFGAGIGVWTLFIFYGIIAGSGCGIAYNAIISLVNPWFPDKIGLCSGVQMMGFGISSLVFGSVANAMFGPFGWQNVFIIIAVVAFIIMLALALVVKPAPKDIAQKLGLSGATATTKTSPTQEQPILKTKVFWLYSIWATVVIACGLTLIGTAGQGAVAVGFATETGFPALLVGLVSTMNGVGRIINGSIFDKAGLLTVMRVAAIFAIACSASLAAALALKIDILYVAAAILIAFPYGSVPVMGSAYARQRYGANGFAFNLGVANCNIASAAVINIVIVAILGSPAAANGPVIYGLLTVLAVVAFLATFVFAKAYKADLAIIAKELE
jgi:OFA family oxalate/formate antiporter-like MFS transporter